MRIIGASIGSAPSACRRLTNSAACSRGRVTRMRFPNSGRESNQRRCSRSAATRPITRMAGRRSVRSLHRVRHLRERTHDGVLGRQRAVVDQRGGVVLGTSGDEQRFEHVRQLVGSGVADDGAVERREAGPVHFRARLAVVLVSANEGQRVAAARIGQRHARVARCADGGGDAGTTSNRIRRSCRKSASEPPESKMNGSPHFRRATVLPSTALSASR